MHNLAAILPTYLAFPLQIEQVPINNQKGVYHLYCPARGNVYISGKVQVQERRGGKVLFSEVLTTPAGLHCRVSQVTLV